MKTIVIAPHPDDEVLGVGGTLLLRKAEGAELAWLIVTGISTANGWKQEQVERRAEEEGVGRAYRLFDDEGRVLVLRPDLTIPIARLVATRMADHPDPVRVSYNARAVRPPVHGKIEGAEQRQAGIELVGAAGPEAEGEVIAALSRALAAAGVPDARVAVGSVAVVSAVLAGAGADDVTRDALWEALRGRSVVDWRRAASGLPLEGDAAAVIADLPALLLAQIS